MTTNPRDADAIADLLQVCEDFDAWIGRNGLFPVVPDRERDALVESLTRVRLTLVGALYVINALDKVPGRGNPAVSR